VEDTPEINRKECALHKSRVACLEFVKQNLTRKGFSDEITEGIIHSLRDSTRNQYKIRWLGFVSWCRERGQDPLKASVPLMADFLPFIFGSKNRTPDAIGGYRTAITVALRFNSKLAVTNDIFV